MSKIKFKIDGGEGEVEGMKIKFGKLCVFASIQHVQAGSDDYMKRQRASGVRLFPGESG